MLISQKRRILAQNTEPESDQSSLQEIQGTEGHIKWHYGDANPRLWATPRGKQCGVLTK